MLECVEDATVSLCIEPAGPCHAHEHPLAFILADMACFLTSQCYALPSGVIAVFVAL
jgi:hypothetical protein